MYSGIEEQGDRTKKYSAFLQTVKDLEPGQWIRITEGTPVIVDDTQTQHKKLEPGAKLKYVGQTPVYVQRGLVSPKFLYVEYNYHKYNLLIDGKFGTVDKYKQVFSYENIDEVDVSTAEASAASEASEASKASKASKAPKPSLRPGHRYWEFV